jgi:hypothetical protein
MAEIRVQQAGKKAGKRAAAREKLKNLKADLDKIRSSFEAFDRSRDSRDKHIALDGAYDLLFRMRTDTALRTAFNYYARENNQPPRANDALTVMRLTYCLHLPARGSRERKRALSRASDLAALINKALAANVSPHDFGKNSRKNSIRPATRVSVKTVEQQIEVGAVSEAIERQIAELLRQAEFDHYRCKLEAHLWKGQFVVQRVTAEKLMGQRFPSIFRRDEEK